MTGFTSSSVSTRSPIITSWPPVPLVMATHPPNPKGVGAARPAMVTLRSARGKLTFSTLSLKSPFFCSVARTAWYSAGISCRFAFTVTEDVSNAQTATRASALMPDLP